jgi:hypothetical protein
MIISLIITVLYLGVCIVAGVTNQDRLIWHTWEQSQFIALFALQTFSQLSIAFLAGFIVRKAFLALGIFLFYYIIVEPISVGILKYYVHDIGRFLPLEISDRMIPVPAFFGKLDKEAYDKAMASINQHIMMTLILTAFVWMLCYYINKRKDLK